MLHSDIMSINQHWSKLKVTPKGPLHYINDVPPMGLQQRSKTIAWKVKLEQMTVLIDSF